MWSELTYLHKQQGFVSTLYQNDVKNSAHYSKLRFNNWLELYDPIFDIPTEVELFLF